MILSLTLHPTESTPLLPRPIGPTRPLRDLLDIKRNHVSRWSGSGCQYRALLSPQPGVLGQLGNETYIRDVLQPSPRLTPPVTFMTWKSSVRGCGFTCLPRKPPSGTSRSLDSRRCGCSCQVQTPVPCRFPHRAPPSACRGPKERETRLAPPQYWPFRLAAPNQWLLVTDGRHAAGGEPTFLGRVVLLTDLWGPALGHHLDLTIHGQSGPSHREQPGETSSLAREKLPVSQGRDQPIAPDSDQ